MSIWQDSTKSIPKTPGSQTVRTPMDELQIGGRKDHIPNTGKSTDMSISHVPSKG